MRGSVLADLAGKRGLAGLPGAEERDDRSLLQLAENLLPVSCPVDHGCMISLKIENATFDFQAKATAFQAASFAWQGVIIFPSRMSAVNLAKCAFSSRKSTLVLIQERKFLPPVSHSS